MPLSAKMKMPAAQLMLDLLFELRRFCAASLEKGSRTLATRRQQQDEIRVESPSLEAPL